jgi:hypothetical protein
MSAEEVFRRLLPAAQGHVLEALSDVETRPIVLALLASWNPEAALARQAEDDLVEVMKEFPDRPVVFKTLATTVGRNLLRMRAAVARALPGVDTEEGAMAASILAGPGDREAKLREFYTRIVLRELEGGGISLGSFDWKTFAIAMAPAAIGVIAPILPAAIGDVFKSIGGAVAGGLSAVFTKAPEVKAPPPPPPPPPPTTTPTTTTSTTIMGLPSWAPWAILGLVGAVAIARR